MGKSTIPADNNRLDIVHHMLNEDIDLVCEYIQPRHKAIKAICEAVEQSGVQVTPSNITDVVFKMVEQLILETDR